VLLVIPPAYKGSYQVFLRTDLRCTGWADDGGTPSPFEVAHITEE
jgi:hypothetical protein